MCQYWPRLFPIDQKRIRVTISEQNLPYFNRNPKESKQWVKLIESAPKRLKTQQSARKVMASVFCDTHGEIFIDYFEKGRTITGAYYVALLDRLVNEIRKKRPHLKKKKILFHDDNAPSHTLNIAQANKHELGFESFPHPPYSSDLAPNDYYLFPNLKIWLCGRRFKMTEKIEWETEGYFGGFDKSYYLEGIEKLKDRWTRCIELKGE